MSSRRLKQILNLYLSFLDNFSVVSGDDFFGRAVHSARHRREFGRLVSRRGNGRGEAARRHSAEHCQFGEVVDKPRAARFLEPRAAYHQQSPRQEPGDRQKAVGKSATTTPASSISRHAPNLLIDKPPMACFILDNRKPELTLGQKVADIVANNYWYIN